MTTPTPMTDAEEQVCIKIGGKPGFIRTEFARQLEAKMTSRLSALEAALNEFIRLDEEGSGLSANDGGELVSALHNAREALSALPECDK